jgi:putative sterol carrier protein
MSDTNAYLQKLGERLTPEKLEQLDAVIGLQLTGAHGGVYTVDARKDGGQGLMAGAPESHGLEPKLTVTVSSEDFVKLANGKLSATTAALTGKLKFKGDMSFALKLAQVL